MKISKTSILTGKINTLDIPISEVEYATYLTRDRPIQEILPNLTVDEREFLISGISQDEWLQAFGKEDE